MVDMFGHARKIASIPRSLLRIGIRRRFLTGARKAETVRSCRMFLLQDSSSCCDYLLSATRAASVSVSVLDATSTSHLFMYFELEQLAITGRQLSIESFELKRYVLHALRDSLLQLRGY